MSDVVIKVENLGKQYRLGQVGTGTLSHDLNRWWHKARGKEDPYLKIGEANDRSVKGEGDLVWALKDINFEVKRGEVLGIIGKNGAGKSTLLKILSQVTGPTVGEIKVKGRIASLLEVGTGFHPELTGRENIYLNGAILGMTKSEIKSKFDEIVDFSGVERYIDTPVKRYSSGMYVRLAFAVAAHLEPEILIVDEVLAVGDAEFQKKCLGKMKDVSEQGRTVLFVSHQLGMINSLCSRGILLSNGNLFFSGATEETIQRYIKGTHEESLVRTRLKFTEKESLKATIDEVALTDIEGVEKNVFDVFEMVVVEVVYTIRERIAGLAVGINIERNGEFLACSFDTDENVNLLVGREAGTYRSKVYIPNPLKAGFYKITSIGIGLTNVEGIDSVDNVFSFTIEENSFDPTFKSYSLNRPGVMYTCLSWNTQML